MSTTMLKYLLMGIKELLKSDRCIVCNTKLPVLSWKRCNDCSKYKKKTVKAVNKKVKPNFHWIDNHNVFKYFQIGRGLQGVDLVNKKCLVFDENNTIIGYK